MPNPITERFIECYRELVIRELVRSGRQFALSLDYYPQSFNDILKGRRDVTIELLRRATERYHFNPEYLLTGSGPLLTPDIAHVGVESSAERIPVVGVRDRTELAQRVDSEQYMQQLSGLREVLVQHEAEEIRAFEISQEDERTAFQRGDLIICRRMASSDWSQKILDGYIYVFVDEDGVKIDRVLNFITDNGTVVLNREVGAHARREVLNIEHILEVWEIRYRISRDIPNPNNQQYRTDQRMSDFAAILEGQSETINALNNTINRFLKQNRVTRL